MLIGPVRQHYIAAALNPSLLGKGRVSMVSVICNSKRKQRGDIRQD
jgi:hypothetical protein